MDIKCIKCKVSYPLTTEFFYKRKNKNGYYHTCKKCKTLDHQLRFSKLTIEQKKERNRVKNPQKKKESFRKYYLANKAKILERHKIGRSRQIGNPNWVKGHHSRKGKKASLETRKKMSESKKGEKCHLWKGGITSETMRLRHSFEYKLWRTAVFQRDNYTCIWCGAKCGNGKNVTLNADHIKPFAHYPELRFAIDNGRTLCLECHKKTDTFGVKARKYNK